MLFVILEPHDSSGTKDDNQNFSSRQKQQDTKETDLKKFQGVSFATSTKDLPALNNTSNISDKPKITGETSESTVPRAQFRIGSSTRAPKDSSNSLDPHPCTATGVPDCQLSELADTATNDEKVISTQANKGHVPNSSFLWTISFS